MRQLILLIFMAGMCGGCINTGPKYKLTVYNANQVPIQDMVVEYNGKVQGSAAVIGSKEVRGQTLKTERMPEEFLLKWKTAEGTPREQLLEPNTKMRRPFEGELYFQINGDTGAKLFVYHSFVEKESDIPWGSPASWEGQPAIPGLNQEAP